MRPLAASKETTPLQKVRAKQMLKLTEAGQDAKLICEVPEVTKMILDRIEIIDPRFADVYFLDGTMRTVGLAKEGELY